MGKIHSKARILSVMAVILLLLPMVKGIFDARELVLAKTTETSLVEGAEASVTASGEIGSNDPSLTEWTLHLSKQASASPRRLRLVFSGAEVGAGLQQIRLTDADDQLIAFLYDQKHDSLTTKDFSTDAEDTTLVFATAAGSADQGGLQVAVYLDEWVGEGAAADPFVDEEITTDHTQNVLTDSESSLQTVIATKSASEVSTGLTDTISSVAEDTAVQTETDNQASSETSATEASMDSETADSDLTAAPPVAAVPAKRSIEPQGAGMSAADLENAKNIFYYNGVITNQHSAAGADTEGPMSVGGNANLFKSSFTYGGNMITPVVGTAVPPEQKVSLLIGGQINSLIPVNYGSIVIQTDAAFTRGYLVSSDLSWSAALDNLSAPLTTTTAETAAIQNTLVGTYEQYLSEFDSIAKNPALAELNGQSLDGIGHGTLYQDPANKASVVAKISADGTGTATIPNITMSSLFDSNDDDLYDDGIQQLIVYSDASKVILGGGLTNVNGSYPGYGQTMVDESGQSVNIFQALSRKIIYVFPNATQVTNYWETDGSAPNDVREDANNNGEDYYDGSQWEAGTYFHGRPTFTSSIVGSVLAPQATVVFSGSNINGYAYAKNLHQRNSMELHYVYGPWAPVEPAEDAALTLNKIDADSKTPLAGAEFILYRQIETGLEYYTGSGWSKEAGAAKEFTTNIDGQIRLTGLEAGAAYYFREIAPPDGYALDPDQVDFEATPSSENPLELVVTAENKATTVLGSIGIKKTDQSGQALNGAKFVVYRLGENGGKEYLQDQYHGNYIWLSGNGDSVPKGATERSTNQQGELIFYQLPQGTYYFRETAAPNGYVMADGADYPVTISTTGQGQTVFAAAENQAMASLMINKTDSNGAPLSGAVFKLVDSTGSEVPDLNYVQSIFLYKGLKNGETYQLTETQFPWNYANDDQPYMVKVDDQGQVTVTDKNDEPINGSWDDTQNRLTVAIKNRPAHDFQVTKMSDRGPLNGATFELQDSSGQIVMPDPDKTKGNRTYYTDIRPGSYTLTEVAAPLGYVGLSESVQLEMAADGTIRLLNAPNGVGAPVVIGNQVTLPLQSLSVTNTREPLPTTPFTVHKTDGTQPLRGAAFTMVDSNGNGIQPTLTAEGTSFTFADLLPTAVINNPLYGSYQGPSYTITESAAPGGYLADPKTYTLTITYDSLSQSFAYAVASEGLSVTDSNELIVANKQIKRSLTINKVDEDGAALAGAMFELKSGYNGDGPIVPTNVSADGTAFTFEDLTYGTYVLRETKLPDGYTADVFIYRLYVDRQGKMSLFDENGAQVPVTNEADLAAVAAAKVVNHKNVREKFQLRVEKTDPKGHLLAGAQFKLVNEATGADELDSSKEPFEFVYRNLAPGDYLLEESIAPEDYQLLTEAFAVHVSASGDITVTDQSGAAVNNEHARYDNDLQVIYIVNERAELPVPTYTFQVDKVDQDGQKLTGAAFRFTLDDQELPNRSSDPAVFLYNDLQPGTYRLTETRIPNGYQNTVSYYDVNIEKDGTITVKDDQGKLISVTDGMISVVNQLVTENTTSDSSTTSESSNSSETGKTTASSSNSSSAAGSGEQYPGTGEKVQPWLLFLGVLLLLGGGVLIRKNHLISR